MAGERPARPCPATHEPRLRRPTLSDANVDWRSPAEQVYDIVRAFTRPFGGARSAFGGRRWRIWRTALSPGLRAGGVPGQVLGPLVSPSEGACGQLVACGVGAIAILEVESEDGTVLHGRALGEQKWDDLLWQTPGSPGAPGA